MVRGTSLFHLLSQKPATWANIISFQPLVVPESFCGKNAPLNLGPVCHRLTTQRQCRDELYWPEAVEVLGAETVGASVAKTNSYAYVLERTSYTTVYVNQFHVWFGRHRFQLKFYTNLSLKNNCNDVCRQKVQDLLSLKLQRRRITTESEAVTLDL